jgi:hypothetical protein
MQITANTKWTIAKDGQSLELTMENIRNLLERLAWSGDLIVFDEKSGRCGESIDEICVSLNGSAIQITLCAAEEESCKLEFMGECLELPIEKPLPSEKSE